MGDINLEKILQSIYSSIYTGLEYYLPKVLGAVVIIGFGFLLSLGVYRIIIFSFKKFKILELIDKLDIKIPTNTEKDAKKENTENEKIKLSDKIAEKIKIDKIIAKAFSYYIFLIFFRFSIVVIGIKEIEDFLGTLIGYLPSLFVGFLIGFFGIRFSNFIYDLTYHALNLTKQKTARIIASGAKIIILFFTIMAVLDQVGIATEIINIILVGFISMLSVAGGLAFGLGGKDIAKEILESFRK
ncbi:hypothetical protein CSB08_00365 [Candidatus Gracilibacteria bacterium]|nr:MAG: hypothetical protein CSB08_00365 [Candidatus Gracilibacteria bacterium]PIE85296.1 MAG: hypothetical protein CSA08_02715 [Candidatus Gracilibacteria bacterium]